MGHIERVEAAMEELRLHPDRVIHQAYMGFALHNCIGLEAMPAEQRQELLHTVALSCHNILCPPLAVGAHANDVYLLIQQNPNRSVDAIAQAAGAARGTHESGEPRWSGDYSAVSLGFEDAEELAPAFAAGDAPARKLFLGGEGQE